MNVFFLIKEFKISQCGLSDYIYRLNEILSKQNFKVSIFHTNKIKQAKSNYKRINWSIREIISEIKSIKGKKIFFFQFSPFLQSRTGFSLKLILIFFFLRIINKDIKLIINFHETCNKFSWQPKYFIAYILHYLQLYLLIFLSHKIFYTNREFLKRFKIFNIKKSKFLEIFSNIRKNSYYKKSNKLYLTFYSSHFNKKNYKIFFKLISVFNLNNKTKIFLNILGNSNFKNFESINSLLLKFNLFKYSSIYKNLNHKNFSKLLFDSKITLITKSKTFQDNSGLHQASIDHCHNFFQLSHVRYNKSFYYIKNQNMFNFLVKKIYKDYNSNLQFKIFNKENKTIQIIKDLSKI